MRVYYSPRQSVVQDYCFSPSSGKPALLVAQWKERWPDLLEFVEPQPVGAEEFSLAHDPEFVQDILACRKSNGFGNRSPEIAESLSWTSGSLVSATYHVLERGGAACSPTSGFHHAGFRHSNGFCTFNGLMVAAILAQKKGARVGILDCDYHYGDGTDNIIKALEIDYVEHLTTGILYCEAEEFLQKLPTWLSKVEVDVLLYQAGADAHLDDPLGGWMTTEQMRLRDRIVFEHCSTAGLPVVWNLAGGYQEDIQLVLDLHHATMEECLGVFGQNTKLAKNGPNSGCTSDAYPGS